LAHQPVQREQRRGNNLVKTASKEAVSVLQAPQPPECGLQETRVPLKVRRDETSHRERSIQAPYIAVVPL